MYSSPPIGVLWLVVLTVPAGQVAEETIIEEEEEEEAEKLLLTKKPRMEEMTNSVEESKVMLLLAERRKELKAITIKARTLLHLHFLFYFLDNL
jgi:hypothetical protein